MDGYLGRVLIFAWTGGVFGLQMWPDLIQKAKEGGLDVIQTYVFWNGHEPSQGKVMDDGIFSCVYFLTFEFRL